MTAVIMAGGKGTRIRSINNEVPKPMIPVCGKPILEHQIARLKENGITDIILMVGYLGEVIKEYFLDGKQLGVTVSYIEEKEPLGTAGAMYLLKGRVKDDFLLLNGDIIFDIDINRFYKFHKDKGGVATLFTHPNNHPYDSAVIVYDDEMRIKKWYHKEEPQKDVGNCVNAGIHLFRTEIFRYFAELKKTDLDRDILRPLIAKERIYAYKSSEYVKDMGTPERFYEVSRDIRAGRVGAKNLSKKQKAVFLDRDGTVNKYVGFLRDIKELELVEGAAEAIRIINRSGFLAIVVTNQPVVARGEVTYQELDEIHKKMETELGKQGAYLDDIFFCPHHPHKGYEGEIAELKIVCDCRKPSSGMIMKAAECYNIDISQSWYIGDTTIDIQTGKNVGMKTILVKTGEAGKDGLFCVKPDYIAEDLLDAVTQILRQIC